MTFFIGWRVEKALTLIIYTILKHHGVWGVKPLGSGDG